MKPVNKIIKTALAAAFMIFALYTLALNIVLYRALTDRAPALSYLFAVSPLPDRVILAGIKTGYFSCPAVLVDVNLKNALKKDFARSIDGLILFWPRIIYRKAAVSTVKRAEKEFVLPHSRYVAVFGGSAEYLDEKKSVRFGLYGISGKSEYAASETKSGEFMAFDMKGYIQGDKRYPVKLNFFYFPYYINRFHMVILGESIDARIFEPFFADYKMIIESGDINIAVQATGENRRIKLLNAMEIKGLKLREDNNGLDIKQLFGVSYEQMGRFLTDSKGDMRVDFQLEVPDSRLAYLPSLYGKKFASEMGDRVKIGIITAPLRGVTDLLWNLTGENVINFLKIFENQDIEKEE